MQRNGTAHSVYGSCSIMVLSWGVKLSFPNAVSFKILSQLAAEENWLDRLRLGIPVDLCYHVSLDR